MNEDDTYIKLRKPSIADMVAILDKISDGEWAALGDSGVDELFESFCWTYAEYIKEYIKYTKL